MQLAAEEVSLISEKLMQMLKAIDPKHFQCGSIRRRKGTHTAHIHLFVRLSNLATHLFRLSPLQQMCNS